MLPPTCDLQPSTFLDSNRATPKNFTHFWQEYLPPLSFREYDDASQMSASPASSDRHAFTPWRFAGFLALLILAAFPQVILGVETFVARDYGFFAYPLAHFQKECFWRGGLPFWDPYNNCGTPFLAQWNTLPLYPPSLLYLLLPLGWSLSFFCLLHLWFAGLGMYFLARRWTGASFAAAFAGLAFAFNGFTLNLLMWPSHIATFAWLPWVVLAAEAAWRQGGKKIPLAAFAGAMQMLAGGPETIFLTWLIIAALWVQQLFQASPPRTAVLWRLPLMAVLVFTLSAAQLLPFLDLVAHAQRETGYTDLRWSMPASGLANFLVPMAFGTTATEGIFFQHGQYWTSSYYLGIGALWLALLSLLCLRDRRGWLLAGIALVALLCALGPNTPCYPLLRKLIPQLSLITYPIKFVMVLAFALPLLAAFALADLGPVSPTAANPRQKSASLARASLLPLGFALLILTGAIVFWTQRASSPGDDAHAALMNGISRAGFLVLTGAVLFALTRNFKSPLAASLPLLLLVIAWLDVFTHEPTQTPSAPPAVYGENLARQWLGQRPQPELGGSRAMLSPAAALSLTQIGATNAAQNLLAKRLGYCANVNLLDAVPKVDGFFSLTPAGSDGLLLAMYAIPNANWSALRNFLGVSQYSSPTNALAWQPCTNFLPLITAGQAPVFLDAKNTITEMGRNHFDSLATAFFPPATRPFITATNRTDAKITNPQFATQTVDFDIDAAAPALAVISQSYYHNWQAEVDRHAAPIWCADVAFQALQVPAGRHHVHVFYRDRAFEIGAAISVCMWVNCLVAWLAFWRRESAQAAIPPKT